MDTANLFNSKNHATMSKKKNNELMQYADRVLTQGSETILNRSKFEIQDSYNGQIAALSVTIAMSGLLPALAIYYPNSNEKNSVDRKNILEIIGRMIDKDQSFNSVLNLKINSAETLLREAIKLNANDLKTLQKEVIDCAIALKQVVRTYKLVKK